jgi:pimeloyl-ACP methyl ester carboxylesterase
LTNNGVNKQQTRGSFFSSCAGSILVMVAAATQVSACATAARSEFRPATNAGECVVLLHGLNRSLRAMEDMAEALHGEGFPTVNIDYPSRAGTIESFASQVVDLGLQQCRDIGAIRIHFVTHSMGGILLRYAQQVSPIPDLGRVVMLGPPNQGSEVVDTARDWEIAKPFFGDAGLELGTDEASIPARLGPVDFELGIIAGVGTINPFMSAILPDYDDGKVTVESTRVLGMADFMIVSTSHHYLMNSETVIQNTIGFLKTGRFPRIR